MPELDMNKWVDAVRDMVARLDAFPKFDTAYLEKTLSGGYVTIVTYTLLGLLMCTELTRYVLPPLQQRYVVDPLLGSQVILSLDISVATPCEKLAVLQVEQTGTTRILGDNVLSMTDEYWDDTLSEDWVKKVREAKDGVDASIYSKVHGCRLRGKLTATKGAGRLMIMPLMSTMGPLGQILGNLDDEINFSHCIHHLAFGRDYPGMRNPLNGEHQLAMAAHEHFTYFLSIISTLYEDPGYWWWIPGNGRRSHYVHTNQYTLTGFRGKVTPDLRDQPGLFFRYDHEALAVIISRERMSLRSFLIHLVGILGGVYVCSGLGTHLLQSAWMWALWLVGRDSARARAKRFDTGWSPVAGKAGATLLDPMIAKSVKTSPILSESAGLV